MAFREQPPGELTSGQTLGRYSILERLGAGGMGVVYAAYDPELDRRVALKILRPETVSLGSKAGEYTVRLDDAGNARDLVRERILAEGRALARLSHPNLITVYEVGAVGEQVYLAMEHVAGVSLSEWLRAAPRTPSDVLAAFVQAGRGLAAAHQAGLVHGDFKPDNVVVDESTGRVCVVDFGLARLAGTGSGPAVVGTPLYMAPEQAAGRPVDARADQFSFAVALHEALHGERPSVAPVSGREGGPPARGPRRAQRAIERALAEDPAGRFPSMAELLSELERRPVALRRGVAAVLALAIVSGLGIALARRGDTGEVEQCVGGQAHLAGVWDPDVRARMSRSFAATGRPHAASSAERAGKQLDAYTGKWLVMQREACLASVRGEQSPDLLDRRMACLDRRLDQVRARTALLAGKPDGEVVDRVVDLVTDIEPLAPCGDAEVLLTVNAPPADPARRATAAAIEKIVDGASLSWESGNPDNALREALEGARRARALDHPPTLARAAYVLGKVHEEREQLHEAEEAMHEALKAAERAGDDALAADILMRLVYVVGNRQARFTEGRTLARLAEAAIGRAGDRAPGDLRARLLGVLGGVAHAQGELAEAESLYRQSLEMRRELLGRDDRRLAYTENMLGNTLARQDRHEEARAHYRSALALRRQVLGEEHPLTSELYTNLGLSYHEQGRFDEARSHYERALDIQSRIPGHPVASVHNNLGALETHVGNFAEGIAHHESALNERRGRLGPKHALVSLSLNNLGISHLTAGRPERALEFFHQALTIRRQTVGESHPLYGATLLSIGEALRRSRRAREGLDYIERAVAILSEKLG
ncbi:MAG TPA: serine/threonine-protein kinase, partial [Kofleriaceae bacterium]|nr:serine/threonine-protein kinase [Kofleriaceae bacterium]